MPDPSPSTLTVQLLTAQKKERWPATAEIPQAVTCHTVKHTALAGIEPTTFRLLVRRATSCATNTTKPLPLTVSEGEIFNGECDSMVDMNRLKRRAGLTIELARLKP